MTEKEKETQYQIFRDRLKDEQTENLKQIVSSSSDSKGLAILQWLFAPERYTTDEDYRDALLRAIHDEVRSRGADYKS